MQLIVWYFIEVHSIIYIIIATINYAVFVSKCGFTYEACKKQTLLAFGDINIP